MPCMGFELIILVCDRARVFHALGCVDVVVYVRFEVFHGGDYEEWRLLECYAVWLL
jgi:hypothetical protein